MWSVCSAHPSETFPRSQLKMVTYKKSCFDGVVAGQTVFYTTLTKWVVSWLQYHWQVRSGCGLSPLGLTCGDGGIIKIS
jgi:hypothetical protein